MAFGDLVQLVFEKPDVPEGGGDHVVDGALDAGGEVELPRFRGQLSG